MLPRSFPALFAGALLGIAATAAAQSTDRLVQEYSSLAGSPENARTLVQGLREGRDFTIAGTSFDTPTRKLGNGEVNIALSLTQARLAAQHVDDPTPAQLEAALAPILQARADGRGWGEIANAMGIRLGEVMRSERSRGHDAVARTERLERIERLDKLERPEHPEHPDRPERFSRAR